MANPETKRLWDRLSFDIPHFRQRRIRHSIFSEELSGLAAGTRIR